MLRNGAEPNYLFEDEFLALNNLVEQYLIFAQGQAMRRVPMHMKDWIKKLDAFLSINDREILENAGKTSHNPIFDFIQSKKITIERSRVSFISIILNSNISKGKILVDFFVSYDAS